MLFTPLGKCSDRELICCINAGPPTKQLPTSWPICCAAHELELTDTLCTAHELYPVMLPDTLCSLCAAHELYPHELMLPDTLQPTSYTSVNTQGREQ